MELNRERYMLIIYFHQQLRLHGFASYETYLYSETWRMKRLAFLRDCLRLDGACEYCGVPLTLETVQVHHATYRNICEENYTQLRALCPMCHDEVNRYEKEHNVTMEEATQAIEAKYGVEILMVLNETSVVLH